jgi:hypothetical protein
MRNFAIAAMLSLMLVPSAVSAQVRCSDKVGFSTYPTGHFLPSPSGRPLDMYRIGWNGTAIWWCRIFPDGQLANFPVNCLGQAATQPTSYDVLIRGRMYQVTGYDNGEVTFDGYCRH